MTARSAIFCRFLAPRVKLLSARQGPDTLLASDLLQESD